jgi:DNA-binding NarL/FixJ family response regulator
MEIPASIRRLLRNITSVSQVPPSWLWLNVNSTVHQTFRPKGFPALVQTTETERLGRAIQQIPAGGHLATFRSPWVPDLVQELWGPDAKVEDHLILPMHHHASLLGCVGWDKSTHATSDPIESIPALRQAFRSEWDLEMALTAGHGLRWVLSRSDRLTAVARPNGTIVAASPAASDLMKSLQFGARHYLHDGKPELPPRLAASLRVTSSDQLELTQTCTVRFYPLNSEPSWLPLIAIEFFVKSQRIPPPISSLTPVERQVYELVVQTGASIREIAQNRGTSYATAKNQVSAVMAKMGVSRRHHLMIHGTGIISHSAQLNSPGMKGVTSSIR